MFFVSFKRKTVLCFLFPILFYSRFVLSHLITVGFLFRSVRLSFLIEKKKRRKHKVLPEVVFWFLFSVLRRFGLVFSFYKKVYAFGHAKIMKMPLMLSKKINNSFKVFIFLKALLHYFYKNGRFINTYWYKFLKFAGFSYSFLFRNVRFDDRFSRIMHFGSFFWSEFTACISIFSSSSSVLHLVFLLREFLKLPLFTAKYKDKGRQPAWIRALVRGKNKRFIRHKKR